MRAAEGQEVMLPPLLLDSSFQELFVQDKVLKYYLKLNVLKDIFLHLIIIIFFYLSEAWALNPLLVIKCCFQSADMSIRSAAAQLPIYFYYFLLGH